MCKQLKETKEFSKANVTLKNVKISSCNGVASLVAREGTTEARLLEF